MEDRELLREYVDHRSDQAFAELVERHVNLVYTAALRLVGESHLAKDVAQAVFIQLARKARFVREGNALPGWLYRVTCATAANAVRAERRRRERETEAVNRAELQSDSDAAWETVAPLLDEAMQGLNRVEQDAIVLRYFEGKSLRDTGAALVLSEDAAQKRVSRALDKLRTHFARRGVAVSSTLLVTAVAAHSVQAAPTGLATTLAGASLAGATGTAAGVTAKFMEILLVSTPAKIAVVAAVVVAGVTPVLLQRASADQALESVIESVKRNEAFYDNIDVTLTETYEMLGESGRPGAVIRDETKVKYVQQDNRFLVDYLINSSGRDGKPYAHSTRRLYDSKLTRLMEANPVGSPWMISLIHGRETGDELVRPHVLLLRRTPRGIVPLSTFLRGREAVEAHLGREWLPGVTADVEYKGEQTYRELRCRLIELTGTHKKSGDTGRQLLWLAEERNYLPVRLESYSSRSSLDIAAMEAEVTEWKELHPGVWFPMKVDFVLHDSSLIKSTGEKKPHWRRQCVIEQVSLEPKYDAAYFEKLEIPAGTTVGYVENLTLTNTGKVATSTTAPSAQEPAAPTNVKFDLKIEGGTFEDNGARKEATLGNVVAWLRREIPDLTITLAPAAVDVRIPNAIKLQSADWQIFDEVLRLSTDKPVVLIWSPGAVEIQPQGDELQAVLLKYQRASSQPLPPADRTAFRTFWEAEFKRALASTTGSSLLRLRMLDELGALQGALGKPDEAFQTYNDMAAYARKVNDLESQLIATENQIGLAWHKPLAEFLTAANNLEMLAQEFANQRKDAAARKRLSDNLLRVGTALWSHAEKPEPGPHSKELLIRAERLFQQAAALGEAGTTPLPTRLWWLARVQSRLGRRAEAAETYGKIIAMDQTVLSRLWMEHLRIRELTATDSPEYQTAVERALTEFKERGGTDEYEISMRTELGRSYRRTKQYAKSTETMNAVLGKSPDPDLNAYNLYLVASNHRSLGDIATARNLFQEVTNRYPKAVSAKLAAEALAEPK